MPDSLDSLTVCLHTLRAPAQFFATKSGEEAQTGPAEYLATSAIMSKGDYSFEAQCSLPGLTTAASAHQADQSLPDQSFTEHHGTKSPWGRFCQSSITEAFKTLQGVYKLQVPGFNFYVGSPAEIEIKKRDGLYLSRQVVAQVGRH